MVTGLVHVHAYDRQSGNGIIHVADYDRSPPGGGGKDAGKPWNGKANSDFRQAIAQAERSAEHESDSYGAYNSAGSGAYGRYQLKPATLAQTGWKYGDRWTEKARQHGVTSDEDFLKKPDAQEAAMSDAMREAERQAAAKGAYSYVGRTFTGVSGNKVTITDAGIAAAAHREGAGATSQYLRRRANNQKAKSPEGRQSDKNVEKRLRDFENVPYTKGNW